MKAPIVYSSAKILLFLLIATCSAHAVEFRSISDGKFDVTVDWKTEPVYEDVPNAIRISIREYDELGFPRQVNDIFGDNVKLKATAYLLETDAFDAKIINFAEFVEPLHTRNEFPYYVSYFKPTHDGAYGFRFKGMINGITIDETFVCGGGTQDVSGNFLDCVVDPKTFPGSEKHYSDSSKDKAGYKDNDGFSLAP